VKASNTPNEVLTDEEVCAMLRIGKSTLRRHLKKGPPRKRVPGSRDVRLIEHFTIGRERRWLSSSVTAFINGETKCQANTRRTAIAGTKA
jgi:predicted DNA-binding transcriptional regulator AlpA